MGDEVQDLLDLGLKVQSLLVHRGIVLDRRRRGAAVGGREVAPRRRGFKGRS
jgi:hypothetical protein